MTLLCCKKCLPSGWEGRPSGHLFVQPCAICKREIPGPDLRAMDGFENAEEFRRAVWIETYNFG